MFYHDGLSKAERVDLERAAEVENLDEEIAVLRVRLKTALKERPEDYALLVRGIGMLTRAVATQYRLSPRASKDLATAWATCSRRRNSRLDLGAPEGCPLSITARSWGGCRYGDWQLHGSAIFRCYSHLL